MTSEINLSDLNGSNGFVLNGIDFGDNSGISVSSAGDVNGDEFDDIIVIIGASGSSLNFSANAGESYVVFGNGSEFAASLDLSSLNGSNGFVLNGIDAFPVNVSVSSAGDVNSDGFDDIIIGIGNTGESYVVFGKSGGFAASLDLSSLDGSNGFALNGIDAFDRSGTSVSSAGDVNGDGFDDIIIGAPSAFPNGNVNAGESYVVFGSGGEFAASLELSSLDGSNGFVLNGIDAGDYSGRSVSGAGDVNGDGFDDIIIGAWRAFTNNSPVAGQSYVVFGKSGGFAASVELSSLDGSNGFVLNGIDFEDHSGFSVSNAGDVNGDGFDDIIIGAPDASSTNNSFAGESYVVFGKSSGFAASVELSSLDGSNGFVIQGIDNFGRSGTSVSGAGDVNGDGFDDVIIGAPITAPNGNSYAGESYVVFGSSGVFAARVEPSSLDGSNGFIINGGDTSEFSGASVSGAGDVNGDGFDDLIIGGPGTFTYNNIVSGQSYVVFGFSTAPIPSPNDDNLTLSADGDIIDALAGNDTIRSAQGNDLVFGNTGNDSISGGFGDDLIFAGQDDDFIEGNENNDSLVGGLGNDTLNGNSENDLLFGNVGNDFLDGGEGEDEMFGGQENDTLIGNANNDTLSGDLGDDLLTGGSEDDVLIGGWDNDILIGNSENDRLFGNMGSDFLDGGEGNDVLFGGKDNDVLIGNNGNDILSGDLGDDRLTGGAGGDRFDFRLDVGNNIITDFTDGQDLIGLTAGLTFEQLTIAPVGNDTQITATGLSITLQGVTIALIDSTDFVLV